MSSPRGLLLLWVTLVLLGCPGLMLLVLGAEQVALVEVYLEQRSDVSALLQGEVVESGKDSSSAEHQDYDRETLEGEMVLVSLGGGVAVCGHSCAINMCETEETTQQKLPNFTCYL